jgi:hypothetical protein
MAFLGAGADVWGPGTLRNGLIAGLLIVPVFLLRHYVQDKGRFPGEGSAGVAAVDDERRAGWWPWVALAGCLVVIATSHAMARLAAG